MPSREELLAAPGASRLLKCLHEVESASGAMWHAYVDPASPHIYPVVQRRGDKAWLLTEGGEMKELQMQELLDLCACGASASG